MANEISDINEKIIVKPIVYGNVARHFGKKRDEDGHTHQWTVYVKPYDNEDMSVYVKKMTFKLHDSYPNCNRLVTKPPYEVTESGWGEFEIGIKIYFHDLKERPVNIYYMLKLFQNEADIMLGKKTLCAEVYDEILFVEPTPMMEQLLSRRKPLTLGSHKHDTDFDEKESRQLHAIQTAHQKLRGDITDLRDKLRTARDTITKFKDTSTSVSK